MDLRFGAMYYAYKDEYWWYEVVELFFRFFMNGMMIHVSPGTISQLLAGLVVCGASFSIVQSIKPFKNASNNTLAILTKFQLLLTLFSMLLLKLKAPFFSQVRCVPTVTVVRGSHVKVQILRFRCFGSRV